MPSERIKSLHAAVSAALIETDAIKDSQSLALDESLQLSDVGIGLDKARAALEQIIWPGLEDGVGQLDGLN